MSSLMSSVLWANPLGASCVLALAVTAIWLRLKKQSSPVQPADWLQEKQQLEEKVANLQQENKRLEDLLEDERELSEALSPIQFVEQALEAVGKAAQAGREAETRARLSAILKSYSSADVSFDAVLERAALEPATKAWLRQYTTQTIERLGQQDGVVSRPPMNDSDRTFATWDFDPLAHSTTELKGFVFKIFHSFNLLERFKIKPALFHAFVDEVEKGYLKVPYHSFYHGVDVLHVVFMFLRESTLITRAKLRSLDVLGLFTAALCHDLGHTGQNNAFHVNSRSPLALLYNDKAVLENHHCATTYQILKKPHCNFVGELDAKQEAALRKTVIECILHTDMEQHFAITARVDDLLSNLPTGDKSDDAVVPKTPTLRRFESLAQGADVNSTLKPGELLDCLGIFLHMADVSNPFKPWPQSHRWTELVTEEFFQQGDLEKAKQLSVMPFMDRDKASMNQSSVNFIDFIVAPLLSSIVSAFPRLGSRATQLAENRQTWHELTVAELNKSKSEETEKQVAAFESRAAKFAESYAEWWRPAGQEKPTAAAIPEEGKEGSEEDKDKDQDVSSAPPPPSLLQRNSSSSRHESPSPISRSYADALSESSSGPSNSPATPSSPAPDMADPYSASRFANRPMKRATSSVDRRFRLARTAQQSGGAGRRASDFGVYRPRRVSLKDKRPALRMQFLFLDEQVPLDNTKPIN